MSRTMEVTVHSPPKTNEVWVPCGNCGKTLCHKVLTELRTEDSTPDGEITFWETFLTIQCGGCKVVSFCKELTSTEDYRWNPVSEQQELAVDWCVYPPRVAGREELQHVYTLPYNLQRIYKETRAVLITGQPVLAGIGIRSIVETVCKDQKADGKDLKTKIDELAKRAIITADAAKILHSLRFMGNEAAHEVKVHAADELATAFDVVEHLLQGLYVIPALAESLPKDPNAKSGSCGTGPGAASPRPADRPEWPRL